MLVSVKREFRDREHNLKLRKHRNAVILISPIETLSQSNVLFLCPKALNYPETPGNQLLL